MNFNFFIKIQFFLLLGEFIISVKVVFCRLPGSVSQICHHSVLGSADSSSSGWGITHLGAICLTGSSSNLMSRLVSSDTVWAAEVNVPFYDPQFLGEMQLATKSLWTTKSGSFWWNRTGAVGAPQERSLGPLTAAGRRTQTQQEKLASLGTACHCCSSEHTVPGRSVMQGPVWGRITCVSAGASIAHGAFCPVEANQQG